MKKLFILFLGLLLLPLTTQATEYKEGTHYKVINLTASQTPEVDEYFSFYCGHCRAFEPLMTVIKTNVAANVKVKKNHVDFLGGEMGKMLTNAYAAAIILQVEDEFSALVFNQLQVQRKAINGEKDILGIFEQVGISEKEAQAALESFTVVGLASQMRRKTEKANIRGVPTLIVNNKYEINRGSVPSAKELVALVNYLTQKQD